MGHIVIPNCCGALLSALCSGPGSNARWHQEYVSCLKLEDEDELCFRSIPQAVIIHDSRCDVYHFDGFEMFWGLKFGEVWLLSPPQEDPTTMFEAHQAGLFRKLAGIWCCKLYFEQIVTIKSSNWDILNTKWYNQGETWCQPSSGFCPSKLGIQQIKRASNPCRSLVVSNDNLHPKKCSLTVG